MSDEAEASHRPLKIALKFVLTMLLVWTMVTYMDQYFSLQGGFPAVVIVGALITLLNMFFRPVLHIITLPLKLFATIFAMILVNGAFVYVVHRITERMEPELVQLDIYGGPWGWIVVACAFGVADWVMRQMFA